MNLNSKIVSIGLIAASTLLALFDKIAAESVLTLLVGLGARPAVNKVNKTN